MKYNVTVRYMRDTIPALKEMLLEMEKERNDDNSQGNVDGTASKASQISNDLNVRFQNWQSQVQTYDSYAQAMTETQKLLAQNALKGKQGVLGTVVKTASLKAALEVGR
jgi:exo-beta-1,3-glucanase (GH17 family)